MPETLRQPTVAPAAEDGRQPLVEVRGVTKVYQSRDRAPVRALDGVDFTVEPGEFTAIAGPSGSGKSTLLNMIGGLDRPTDGSVVVAGHALRQMSRGELADFRLRNLGFIFQAFNLIPVLSAEENAEFTLLMQGVPAAERRQRVRQELAELGIEEDQFARRPAALSGGQQQRVAIARALVSNPALILADEPTANLDSVTGARLLDKMRDMNEKTGVTFLFSTHDPMVMERARRLVYLRDGQIVSDERR
jgi:putative ABC transport system ATP-binding protein